MSLIQKKREMEKMRSNGLNDPAFKPAVAQQANNSWANNMQQPLTYSTTPVKSFSSLPIHKPNNLSHGQEKDDVMKSLIQQSSLHAALPNRKQMTDLPGWTISQNSANPNPAEPVIDMSNLPEGSYFDEDVYIDSTTNKEIKLDPEQLVQAQLGKNTSIDVNIAQQCNCSTCIPKN